MSKKAKVFHTVGCSIHGNVNITGHYRELVVPAPVSKAKRKGMGCPVCRKG